MDIFKSATKNVFMLVALTVCVWFILWKLSDQQFLWLAMLVFAFYYKGSTTTSDSEFSDFQNKDKTISTTTNTQTNTQTDTKPTV